MTARVKPGDLVIMRCTTKDESGAVVESTDGNALLELRVGRGRIPDCIEQSLLGMRAGDRLSSTFGPFAPRRDELVHDVAREALPDDAAAVEGEKLRLRYENGKERSARITQVSESSVTVDANHPLAGQKLHLDIELVAIL
jgi:peptidylprolyl isomerase